MTSPQWVPSDLVRDSMIMLEGVEPGSPLRDQIAQYAATQQFLINDASLAHGDTPQAAVKPVVDAYREGCRSLLTIAPVWGTANEDFDWLIITDHVNLSGENPLRGGPLVAGNPWFTPMGDAYADLPDSQLKEQLQGKGSVLSGVLAGLSGPTHPTAAEKKVLAAWGCVAYSWHIFTTSIAAAHLGMRFVAIGWYGDRETALLTLLRLWV
jgi:hypothetical protein